MKQSVIALFIAIMSTLLKALSLRSYGVGAGFLSSAYLTHNLSKRAVCEPTSRQMSSASVALANNPLLKKDSTPLFAEITNEHILPAVQKDLASLKTGFSGKFLCRFCHTFNR